MKKTVVRWIEDAWYQEMYLSSWFSPLSMFYADVVRLRRYLYRVGVLKSTRLPVPVVIVGNITVGGTGKTPLVIWLAQFLKAQGFQPGVISRGYAGKAAAQPQAVAVDGDAAQVGDEALLLARHAQCPVVVGVDRVAAAQKLLAENACDIIISDDGLQHYALQRDLEIVVIDGQRRIGNGYCLPVGPLREPPHRIKEVDLVVINDGEAESGEFVMQCQGDKLINLSTGEQKSLEAFKGLSCHAVAAVGNPARFFKRLERAGLQCQPHAFPDHYAYQQADIVFNDQQPVLMTEKDAVKCQSFADSRHWYLPVSAQLPDAFAERLISLLRKPAHG